LRYNRIPALIVDFYSEELNHYIALQIRVLWNCSKIFTRFNYFNILKNLSYIINVEEARSIKKINVISRLGLETVVHEEKEEKEEDKEEEEIDKQKSPKTKNDKKITELAGDFFSIRKESKGHYDISIGNDSAWITSSDYNYSTGIN